MAEYTFSNLKRFSFIDLLHAYMNKNITEKTFWNVYHYRKYVHKHVDFAGECYCLECHPEANYMFD